jgi:hypothetical protein
MTPNYLTPQPDKRGCGWKLADFYSGVALIRRSRQESN